MLAYSLNNKESGGVVSEYNRKVPAYSLAGRVSDVLGWLNSGYDSQLMCKQ